MSLKAIVDLRDDWKRGRCSRCPFGFFDDEYNFHYCGMGYSTHPTECKLKVVDSEGDIDL